VTGIIAQRLIRRLCACRKSSPVTPEFTAQLLQCGITSPPQERHSAVGCDECDLTGYKGRIGIYEMLYLDDSIRSAIRDGGRSDTIRALARANGMRLMHEYALEHILHGLTTLEEVQRVVPLEQVASVNCASCFRELSPSFVFCPYCGERRTAQETPLPPQTAVELGVVSQ
jgi:type II secretory ATPase GspE/PulE/Tfp pilus assembly ATPase PilB-like protein